MTRNSFFIAVLVLLVASQVYWLRVLGKACLSRVRRPLVRQLLAVLGIAAYVFLFIYNVRWGRRTGTPVRLTFRAAVLEAPFTFWLVCSLVGFIVAAAVQILGGLARAAHRLAGYRKLRTAPKETPPAGFSPGRRLFLERTALAAGSIPFVAGAYGLLYARTDLETTRKTIHLARLPKAFHGFRIAQVSDLHIGPFMTAEEIRKVVEITNRLRPDLTALTGDFITWDPGTQEAVVDVLSNLKAPFGVFGCLGNHEMWTGTEESITRLFTQKGIRILRQARAPIAVEGETLQLLGVDFQTRGRMGSHGEGLVQDYLPGVQKLMQPESVHILLSHNPNSFDRAAQLGIDLTLAGHTHGGQVALEFVHRNISPSRLITDYVKGWFQKGGSQLYVNRGIGTIFVPIRLNAPPEITLFELVRS